MKKIICLSFACLMAILLAACQDMNEDPTVPIPSSDLKTATPASSGSPGSTAPVTATEPATSDGTEPTPTADPTVEPSAIETDNHIMIDPAATPAATFYTSHCQVTKEKFTMNFNHVYYENGHLIVKLFICNGFKQPMKDFRNVHLSVRNGVTVFANATFDSLNNLVITPNTYAVWTFTFPDDSVYAKNIDLSLIELQYSAEYSF